MQLANLSNPVYNNGIGVDGLARSVGRLFFRLEERKKKFFFNLFEKFFSVEHLQEAD